MPVSVALANHPTISESAGLTLWNNDSALTEPAPFRGRSAPPRRCKCRAILFVRRLDRPRSGRHAAPGHRAKGHGGAGDMELVEIDEFVRAVSLRDAPWAEDRARNPDLRIPGQLRSCSERLDSRFPSCFLERGDQTLDDRVLRRSLRGREIDIAQFPGESW